MLPAPDPARVAVHRRGCRGVTPLDGRLERWQVEFCDDTDRIEGLLRTHGSPINVIDPTPMGRNAEELTDAASRAGVALSLYFARKANKALSLVDEARRLGLGVDLASERELVQVLGRGVPGEALVMTAAVKPAALLELCVRSGTTVVADNRDELRALAGVAAALGTPARTALRLTADLGPGTAPSRFGFERAEALALAAGAWDPALSLVGVHFHLHGYDTGDRVRALDQAVTLVDGLRARGHDPGFIDIGGGIPMSYLDSAEQWDGFWTAHHNALLGRGDPLTYDNHGLGVVAHRGEVVGVPATYPYHQPLVRGRWLEEILDAPRGSGGTVAASLRERHLELRCEPGRALVDGCGLTIARVAHRKQRRDGDWLIGLEMNRTQCRSTSADFLVDPLLLRPGHGPSDAADAADAGPIEGFLVGAYCIEAELLTWRRLRFPAGVRTGDLVVFPNTAGYLMHILESSSHQIPLARNLVVGPGGTTTLDPIDA